MNGVVFLTSSNSGLSSCHTKQLIGQMIYAYHNRTDYVSENCDSQDSLIVGIIFGSLGGLLLIIIIIIYIVVKCKTRQPARQHTIGLSSTLPI